MKYIEDNIVLLGLIATTVPFTYENGIVSANFSGSISKDDLDRIKAELVAAKESATTDEQRLEITDELYFIETILRSLGMN